MSIYQSIITPLLHKEVRKQEGLSTSEDTLQIEADAVVIGSGAGGAVAAKELAQAGWKTVLIEEGSYFTVSNFTADEFESVSNLYRDGSFIQSENASAAIIQGRTIGGSTTVNWQTCLYPPKHIPDEWEKKYGLSGYSALQMRGFIKEVSKRLGIKKVKPELINENNQVLLDGSKKLGHKINYLRNNNDHRCIGTGRCGQGCPVNAKQSAFLTWIPDAITLKAKVFANFRAVLIEDNVGYKVVTAEFAPPPENIRGNEKKDSHTISKLNIKARVVVVSAGALESPALLQRSNLGNDFVGKNLKLHPVAQVFAIFDHKIDMYHGPPQSIAIDQFLKLDAHGYGFWLEVAPHRPTLFNALLPFKGKQHFDYAKQYPYIHSGLVLVRDGSAGISNESKVEWADDRRQVHFKLSKEDGLNMLHGIKTLAEIQVAAGAKELIFPFQSMKKGVRVTSSKMNFDWVLKQETLHRNMPVGSAHPHGSVQAAVTPDLGAINPDFELFGHKNIFVMDASWYPTGLGVNPQITTMSSVMKAARKLGTQKNRLTG